MSSDPNREYLELLIAKGRTPTEIATQLKIGLDRIEKLIAEFDITTDNIEDEADPGISLIF